MARLKFIESPSLDPYYNLALEKRIFDTLERGEVVLYLWQNEKTVVCGRNQNVYKECRVSRLEANGGRLARRLSGGGAVFHDVGNLNFTFAAFAGDYSVEKQLEVIKDACLSFGVSVELSGRNDITAGGKKFSGSAFLKRGERRCHHGTLMINVDFSELSSCLSVDKSKLSAKGVSSVGARVVNLSELAKGISTDGMKAALRSGFEGVYGGRSETVSPASFDGAELMRERERFSSPEWIFGQSGELSQVMSKRFAWGDFELNVCVEGGKIREARIFSDALDADFILALAKRLEGVEYSAAALSAAVSELKAGHEAECTDITGLVFESI